MSFTFRRHKKLHKQAYAAFDSGELAQAAEYFAKLVKRFPDDSAYHYMQGLTAKNRMDWPTALHANLRAIECADGFAEGAHWNAAIAATALHDWDTARRMWAACGIAIPEGEDEIRADFGIAVIRLNPWADGETVYARRIDRPRPNHQRAAARKRLAFRRHRPARRRAHRHPSRRTRRRSFRLQRL